MNERAKQVFAHTLAGRVFRRVRERKRLLQWQLLGRPVPPPILAKHAVIREYARRYALRVFIETGTYLGDTVRAHTEMFDRLYSIELDGLLYERAAKRFARCPHVEIIRGDSAKLLPRILATVNEPCLFWLDGHYSGGATAHGETPTPVMHELRSVFDHEIEEHVVLIDDARCFVGRGGYPTIEQLSEFAHLHRPRWTCIVDLDIIRLHR